MARIGAIFLRATAIFLFCFCETVICATFLVCAGGAAALKVAQVPNNAKKYTEKLSSLKTQRK